MAEVQPILCKDSANREKYKEKHSFSFISEVQPIEEALPQR